MRRVNLIMAAFLVFGLFALSTSGYAQDKEISKSKVPQKVLNAFHKAYPNAEIKGTSIENEGGKKYYEIESVEGENHIDLLITESGKISEVEKTIETDELPSNAMKSLKAKFKSFKVEKAEKVTSGNKITYELAVESNDNDYEVVLNSNGRVVKTEKMSEEGGEKGEAGEKGESGENEENDND